MDVSDYDTSEFLNSPPRSNEITSDSDDDLSVVSKREKRKSDQTATNSQNNNKASASSGAVPNRLSGILAQNEFKSLDLEKYLRENKARAVVFVGNKNGILTKANRKLLTNILAEFILEKTYRPTSSDFITIRDKIYGVFPNEPEYLYYAAPKEISSLQTLAKGKLFDRVKNKISRLIEKGVIEPRRKRRSKVLENSSDNEENHDEPSSEVTAALVVLKRARQITPDIEEKWASTSHHRLQELYRQSTETRKKAKKSRTSKKENRNDPVPDLTENYFEEFKLLKQPTGYKLLLSDFKSKFADKIDLLLTNWDSFAQKLKRIALSLNKIDDPVGKELLEKLKSADGRQQENPPADQNDIDCAPLDDNGLDALLLLLLPSLCPPTARVVIGSKTQKPSVTESRDAFICHVTVAAEIEPLVERRRKRMAAMNATLQPFLIFLGPERWNITASYVVCDRILYKLDSVLDALDTCFKIFHAVCLSYPKEANHLWHIFHLYVYKVEHNALVDGDILDCVAALRSTQLM